MGLGTALHLDVHGGIVRKREIFQYSDGLMVAQDLHRAHLALRQRVGGCTVLTAKHVKAFYIELADRLALIRDFSC